MKILLSVTAMILSSAAALACSVMPGFEIPYKNRALAAVANKYRADLSTAEISVEDYKHAIAWKFTDGRYQCHDSNTVSMKVTLKYGNPWNSKEICLTQAQIIEASAPEVKAGPEVVKTEIQEIANTCK